MHSAGVLDEGLDDVDDINRARNLPSPQLVGSHDKKILDLNSMTDAGMAHLQNLTSLRRLGLYSNPNITDVGVAHLRQLKSLQSLHLQFTKISDKGLAHLEDLPLRFLDVRGTQVTDTGRKDYRSRHRYCRVLK